MSKFAPICIYLVISPLELFSIHPLIPIKIGNFYFSFTNPSLSMLLTLSLVLLLFSFVSRITCHMNNNNIDYGGGVANPNGHAHAPIPPEDPEKERLIKDIRRALVRALQGFCDAYCKGTSVCGSGYSRGRANFHQVAEEIALDHFDVRNPGTMATTLWSLVNMIKKNSKGCADGALLRNKHFLQDITRRIRPGDSQ